MDLIVGEREPVRFVVVDVTLTAVILDPRDKLQVASDFPTAEDTSKETCLVVVVGAGVTSLPVEEHAVA